MTLAPKSAVVLSVLRADSAAAVVRAREARARREADKARHAARGTIPVVAADTARGRTPIPPGVRDALAQDKRHAARMADRVNVGTSAHTLAAVALSGAPMLMPTASHGNGWAAPSAGPVTVADAGPILTTPGVSAPRVPVPADPHDPRFHTGNVPRYVMPRERAPFCHAHGCAVRHSPAAAPFLLAHN